MKKLSTTIFLLAFCLSSFSQSSPHWTFAKNFGGIPADAANPNNVPDHMAMDDNGNVYIFGTYGQPTTIDSTDLPVVGTDDTRGNFLAKFNCQGEVEWTKGVKCEQFDADANWMQIKNDTIYIMGEVRYQEPYNTYFLDSMIYASQTNYPYTYPWIGYSSWYNYFAKIDLEGNVLETHFLHKKNGSDSEQYNAHEYCPFYVTNNHVYIMALYTAHDGDYSFYIDSIEVINQISSNFNNYILTKYDTDFNPIWHKTLIDSLSAWQSILYFNDMATDADNNMYYAGKAELLDTVEPYNPPGTIYLADGHSIEFQEHGKDIGFVMKIDSAGTIQWVEQMYRETDTTYGGHSEFYSVDINEDDGELYISGRGNAVYYNNSSFHSIFPNGDAFEAPCYECSGNTGSASYLLAMDKNDGTVLWHSSPYTESRNYIGNVEYANDSLYVGLRWGTALHFQDTVFMHDGSKPTFTIGFSHLTYNTAGELSSVRNLRTDNGFDVWAHDTKVDAAGNIFFTGRMDADLDFNGDTSLFVSSASMFLARYGTECPVYGDTSVLVCRGTAFSFAGQEFTTPGVHPVLVESSGTDSIVNLHLQHTPAISSGLPQDTLICTGYAANFTAAPGYESYLWQDGSTGQMFSTTYSAEQTDTLTVTMGKTFDTPQGDMYCEWTDTIIVSAEICNSYELQQQAGLQLHPNPAGSSTEVAFPATQNATLWLYDSSGRLVQQTQISGSSYHLNLSNLEKGLYHIKLISEEFNLCEKLIIN